MGTRDDGMGQGAELSGNAGFQTAGCFEDFGTGCAGEFAGRLCLFPFVVAGKLHVFAKRKRVAGSSGTVWRQTCRMAFPWKTPIQTSTRRIRPDLS